MTIDLFLPLILGLRGPEILIIALVVLLLFGASRIPKMMRSLGKGLHSFRQGIEDAKEEMNKEVVKAGTSKPEGQDAAAAVDAKPQAEQAKDA